MTNIHGKLCKQTVWKKYIWGAGEYNYLLIFLNVFLDIHSSHSKLAKYRLAMASLTPLSPSPPSVQSPLPLYLPLSTLVILYQWLKRCFLHPNLTLLVNLFCRLFTMFIYQFVNCPPSRILLFHNFITTIHSSSPITHSYPHSCPLPISSTIHTPSSILHFLFTHSCIFIRPTNIHSSSSTIHPLTVHHSMLLNHHLFFLTHQSFLVNHHSFLHAYTLPQSLFILPQPSFIPLHQPFSPSIIHSFPLTIFISSTTVFPSLKMLGHFLPFFLFSFSIIEPFLSFLF